MPKKLCCTPQIRGGPTTMVTRSLGLACIIAACLSIGEAPAGAQPQPSRLPALSEGDIVQMLNRRTPSTVIERLVSTRGVTFEITPSIEATLKKSGATDKLIDVLRSANTQMPSKQTADPAAVNKNPAPAPSAPSKQTVAAAPAGKTTPSKDSSISSEWTYIYTMPPSAVKNWACCLAFDPNDSKVIYAALRRQIVKSDDAGQSWTSVPSPFNDETPWINAIQVAPDSGILYVAADKLFKSTSTGKEWVEITPPQAKNYIKEYSSLINFVIDPRFKGQALFCDIDNAVMRSINGGRVWKVVAGDFDPSLEGKFGGLVFDSKDPDVVYAHPLSGFSTSLKFYRSGDAGQTWRQVLGVVKSSTSESQNLLYRLTHLVSAPSGNTLYAELESRTSSGERRSRAIVRTTDAGEHWEIVYADSPYASAAQMVADNEDVDTFYMAERSDVLKITNGKIVRRFGSGLRAGAGVIRSIILPRTDHGSIYVADDTGIAKARK